jgi:hypothetical protein
MDILDSSTLESVVSLVHTEINWLRQKKGYPATRSIGIPVPPSLPRQGSSSSSSQTFLDFISKAILKLPLASTIQEFLASLQKNLCPLEHRVSLAGTSTAGTRQRFYALAFVEKKYIVGYLTRCPRLSHQGLTSLDKGEGLR